MGKYYISIRTKLLALFSILLILVLVVQYLLMDQAQGDLLEEFAGLSRDINRATSVILTERNDEEVVVELRPPPQVKSYTDSIVATERELRVRVDALAAELEREVFVEREFIQPPHLVDKSQDFIWRDSLEARLHSLDSFLIDKQVRVPVRGDAFSFFLPGQIDDDDAPRVFRYSYSTAGFEDVIDDARDRNIWITLALMVVGISGIFLISQRIEKPIRELRDAFHQVVDGDLGSHVEPAANDEIGELAMSFNTMVGELRKNRTREELSQRREKLAALGQLAAGVAHEIKNPLNAIGLTVEHLRDQEKNSPARPYLETIQDEIRRLDKTTNNFLQYVRDEELKRERSDMHRLLDEILALYERELVAKEIVVHRNYHGQWDEEIDKERLQTAIVNLLVNAIAAMEKAGELSISTDPIRRELRLGDTGHGISKEKLPHIFDLYYTSKASGTGLGLPTADKIIRAHGASLQIESTAGLGTSVIIRFEGA
jgi:signal transduction histidine kinase